MVASSSLTSAINYYIQKQQWICYFLKFAKNRCAASQTKPPFISCGLELEV